MKECTGLQIDKDDVVQQMVPDHTAQGPAIIRFKYANEI